MFEDAFEFTTEDLEILEGEFCRERGFGRTENVEGNASSSSGGLRGDAEEVLGSGVEVAVDANVVP